MEWVNTFEFGLFCKPKSPKPSVILNKLSSINSPNDIDKIHGQSPCATKKAGWIWHTLMESVAGDSESKSSILECIVIFSRIFD